MSAFGLIVKSAQHTNRNPVAVGCINYIFAGIASTIILFFSGHGERDYATISIGASTGVFYVVAYWFLVIAMRQGGVAITMAIARLAVLVPILCSIFIWYEMPSVAQTIGIVCVCAALPFLSIGIGGKTAMGSTVWLITALFITTGFCHLSPKLLHEVAPEGQMTVYLASLFSIAGLLSILLIRWQRIKVGRRDYGHGIILGTCNLLGTYCIAVTLQYLPGTLVYPFTSAAGVVLTTCAATLVWKEKIGRTAYFGICLTVIALVLVN